MSKDDFTHTITHIPTGDEFCVYALEERVDSPSTVLGGVCVW